MTAARQPSAPASEPVATAAAGSLQCRRFGLVAAGHGADGREVMYERQNVLLKPLDEHELAAYMRLETEFQDDPIREFVPKCFGVEGDSKDGGGRFLCLENLAHGFDNPRVMDVKLGMRTYLDSDVSNAAPRADLFQKMVSFFPDDLTAAERKAEAVTKRRYMAARDAHSTSSSCGFRISGMAGCPPGQNIKGDVTSSAETVRQALRAFARSSPEDQADGGDTWRAQQLADAKVASRFAEELRRLRGAMEASAFVKWHECIGTSVLLVADSAGRCGVSWIDFAKARPCILPQGLDHRVLPGSNSQEDGILLGLDCLISLWDEIAFTRTEYSVEVHCRSRGHGWGKASAFEMKMLDVFQKLCKGVLVTHQGCCRAMHCC
eukprot:TRINITY_DN28491_c0_g1_i1.p1 TRINITY_DN28491_c0_g1~~TRINITY_DN28491_c0_g1_i1.p1  ORF type:complete len:378 (+),score=79.19 TRINITY_DN28491_c0_g1_i1:245-1378(+)